MQHTEACPPHLHKRGHPQVVNVQPALGDDRAQRLQKGGAPGGHLWRQGSLLSSRRVQSDDLPTRLLLLGQACFDERGPEERYAGALVLWGLLLAVTALHGL